MSARKQLAPNDVAGALAANQAKLVEFEGLRYVRMADDTPALRRGTVVLGNVVVPPFPSIGRIFVLEAGVRRAFTGEVWAEEKIDGYNVRIARVDGTLLPFTRGGFVCPFTFDRLADLADLGPLFDAHPDLVLCGEVAGPGNPYMPTPNPHVPEDVGFFAFDLMRCGETGFLPLVQREELFARFALPRAPLLGRYAADDVAPLKREIVRLHREGGEGVVLKPPGEGDRVKYVTPGINLIDIAEESALLAELPAAFFRNRLLRLAIDLGDLDLLDELPGVEARLGGAFLHGLMMTLEQVRREGVVAKTFSVRLRSEASADRLLAHLNGASRKIKVREVSRAREGVYVRLVFEKIYAEATSFLRTVLDGAALFD